MEREAPVSNRGHWIGQLGASCANGQDKFLTGLVGGKECRLLCVLRLWVLEDHSVYFSICVFSRQFLWAVVGLAIVPELLQSWTFELL